MIYEWCGRRIILRNLIYVNAIKASLEAKLPKQNHVDVDEVLSLIADHINEVVDLSAESVNMQYGESAVPSYAKCQAQMMTLMESLFDWMTKRTWESEKAEESPDSADATRETTEAATNHRPSTKKTPPDDDDDAERMYQECIKQMKTDAALYLANYTRLQRAAGIP